MKSIARPGLLAIIFAAAALAGTATIGSAHAQTTPKAYAETRYPVILVHGIAGAGTYKTSALSVISETVNTLLKSANLGISLPTTDVDYWYGFKQDLERNGAKVYVANLEAFNSDDAKQNVLGLFDMDVGRGEQLLQYVRTVLAQTGANKVNLIGHDQGGMTARYVASVAPGLVASVTTIGTPHKGTPLVDEAIRLLDQQKVTDAVTSGLTTAGMGMSAANGRLNIYTPFQSARAAFDQLGTTGAKRFNERFPSAGLSSASCASGAAVATVGDNVQRMYSYSGAAIRPISVWGARWVSDDSLSWFLDSALWNDPSTLALSASGLVLANLGDGTNDGFVSTCSAMYGKVIGTYRWNHLDEINQFLGIRGGRAEDPVAVMRTHLNRLQNDGV